MLRQLALGSAVSLANIAVHAGTMAAVIYVFRRRQAAKNPLRIHFHFVTLMIAVVAVLNVAHMIEAGLWSFVYSLLDVTPPGASSFYFALVNFTTLGYGDTVPVPRWQLLGPITAMNGVLLLGWSTAVIFAVLSSQINLTLSDAGR